MPTPKPLNASHHMERGTVTLTMLLQKLALHRWTIPHMSLEKYKDALYFGTCVSGTNQFFNNILYLLIYQIASKTS